MSIPVTSPADPATQRAALKVVLLSVVLNATGQVLFKAARNAQPDGPLLTLFLLPQMWLGLSAYGLSAVTWLWVLSRAQLSYAYPILALTFPIVVALSGLLFGEAVGLLHWIGIAVIVTGVSLLART